MAPRALILASGSPRRKDLLAQLSLHFTVDAANVDEGLQKGEAAAHYVTRLAREKAQAVALRHPGALVLGADTSVVLDGEVLGKPADEEDAIRMLSRLSGRVHEVYTGVALAGAFHAERLVRTEVEFRQLQDAEVRWYARTGEPRDKAGAYAVQGIGGFLVAGLRGSYSNVVGLPLAETVRLLEEAGAALPWGAP